MEVVDSSARSNDNDKAVIEASEGGHMEVDDSSVGVQNVRSSTNESFERAAAIYKTFKVKPEWKTAKDFVLPKDVPTYSSNWQDVKD